MAEFGTSMMDRQRLELKRNAYDAFVTLPRMAPDLIRRYFTERVVILPAGRAAVRSLTA